MTDPTTHQQLGILIAEVKNLREDFRRSEDKSDATGRPSGADCHKDALQRLGRVMLNSIAEIIEADGGRTDISMMPKASLRILAIAITRSFRTRRPQSRTLPHNSLATEL